jgi:hypothetical protein
MKTEKPGIACAVTGFFCSTGILIIKKDMGLVVIFHRLDRVSLV